MALSSAAPFVDDLELLAVVQEPARGHSGARERLGWGTAVYSHRSKQLGPWPRVDPG